jgi:hypothetical protein
MEWGRAFAHEVASRDPLHITGHLVFVLISAEWTVIFSEIDIPTSWEFALLSTFFVLKTLALQKSIANYARTVYGQNIVSGETVV